VEDSRIILQNLTDTLEQELALTVVGSADSAPAALSWMMGSKAPCDLMIIDVFLRQGTGLDVLNMAKERMPQCRKVVLTNYATKDIRARCLAMGAHEVFDKSSELEELIAYCADMAHDLGSNASGEQAH
jgi:DNA-binding NarL/FixJ family response regulator